MQFLTSPVPRAPLLGAGITFSGANLTMMDGYDVNYATMVTNCARTGAGSCAASKC